jgi:hypothetical protein
VGGAVCSIVSDHSSPVIANLNFKLKRELDDPAAIRAVVMPDPRIRRDRKKISTLSHRILLF